MRIFLTGGSGFLGRNLIPTLLARGHALSALARSAASIEIVRAAGAEPVAGDLDDEPALRGGMAGCDAVIHAAASTKEWAPYEEFHRINVVGTERVIAAARQAGVRRLVHISTEAVLLDGSPLIGVDETRPLPDRPIGAYPATKGLAERRVREANGEGLETVVVRPRFVWGKGDTTLLPKLVEAVQQGRFRWISGGHVQTSTCHVANACEGIALAAERGRPGEVYFLTDGPPVEAREFLTALLRTQGVDPGGGSVPRWLAGAAAAAAEAIWTLFRLDGAPPATRTAVMLIGREVTVSDAKARSELGYSSAKSRGDGLRELRACAEITRSIRGT